jgi:AcrR family transcriptional regulator
VTEDRRARKKRSTQQALRISALRLVDAHGLENVTVEMIAEAADVARRTFFNHFATKEDALLGPGAEARSEVEQFWLERPDGESAFDTLRALLIDRAGHLSEKTEELDLRMRVLAANPALYPHFHAGFLELERVVRAAVADRTGLDPEHDLYPRLLAATGGAAMRASMDLWRAGDSNRRLADVVTEAIDLYAAGLDVEPRAVRAPTRRRRTTTGVTAHPITRTTPHSGTGAVNA